MSGGSMDYLYSRVLDATFEESTPLRRAFRKHLFNVAGALRAIEWNDSCDGDDREDACIMACLPGGSADVLAAAVEEAERVLEDLRIEIGRAKNPRDKFREGG